MIGDEISVFINKVFGIERFLLRMDMMKMFSVKNDSFQSPAGGDRSPGSRHVSDTTLIMTQFLQNNSNIINGSHFLQRQEYN